MQKTVLRTFTGILVLALTLAASASALHLQVGNIVVDTDGGFTPQTLPKHKLAPIKLHGYGKISTADKACRRSSTRSSSGSTNTAKS